MIKNERQLKNTTKQVEKFKEHLSIIEALIFKEENELLQMEAEAIVTQIEELQAQIDEYYELWESRQPIPSLQSIEDIPQALIKARLSLGLSQKEFANLVDLKEQQIQRYEATNYETISLSRLIQFAKILEIEMPEQIRLPSTDNSLKEFFRKMNKAGISRRLLLERVLTPSILSEIDSKNGTVLSTIGIQNIGLIGRIFGWSPKDILQSRSLNIDTSLLGPIRFKIPKRINEKQIFAYTSYSKYLVEIILNAATHLTSVEFERDPIKIHRQIVGDYGSFTVESAIRYIWKNGIPVISVDDLGGFHGAHFKKEGRSAILLNQRTVSRDIWLFSLFHEFWHVIENKNTDETFIEYMNFDDLYKRGIERDDEEEKASRFATAVLIGQPPGALLKEAMKLADHDLLKLKKATTEISKREGISAGALANYIAFRLQDEKGENWWGAAQALQEKITDIQIITRNILLDNIDLSNITGMDLDLLRRALIKT